MMIEFDGRVRSWESFASGRAIHDTYAKYAYEITNKKIWDKIAVNINRGLLSLVPSLEPDVVVIGGSIGTHFDRYNKTLMKLLDETLPVHIKRPKIVQAKHPEEAVIYGCYYYALQQIKS